MLSQAFTNSPIFLSCNLSPPSFSEDNLLIPQYPKKAGKWTFEEDELLRKHVETYGEKQWRKISQHIPGRTSIQCLHRWSKILRPGLVKGPWTSEEDEKLIAWVKAEGANKWAQAASIIVGRSGKQCRERWFNNLSPDVKKGEWAKEEDELIFELYKQHGSSWSKIAKFVPGRTENSIKNRFYSTLRKIAGDRRKIKSKSSPSENSSAADEEPVEETSSKTADESESPRLSSTLYKLLQDNLDVLDPEKDIKEEESEGLNQISPSCDVFQEKKTNSPQSAKSKTRSVIQEQENIQQNTQKIALNTSSKLSTSSIFSKPASESFPLSNLMQQNLSQSCYTTTNNLNLNSECVLSLPPLNLNVSNLSNFPFSIERLGLSKQDTSDLSNPIEVKLEDPVQLQIPKLASMKVPEKFCVLERQSFNRTEDFPLNTKRSFPYDLLRSDLSERCSLSQPIVVEKRFWRGNPEPHFGFRTFQDLRTRKETSQDSTQASECELNEWNRNEISERSEADMLMLLRHLYSLESLIKTLKPLSTNLKNEVKVKVEAPENNENSKDQINVDVPMKKIKLY